MQLNSISMDIAYDHVQEEALSPSEEDAQDTTAAETSTNLNADLQQAFQAVSSSPWAVAWVGGSVKRTSRARASSWTCRRTRQTRRSRQLKDGVT